jgi:hypothetical protein
VFLIHIAGRKHNQVHPHLKGFLDSLLVLTHGANLCPKADFPNEYAFFEQRPVIIC